MPLVALLAICLTAAACSRRTSPPSGTGAPEETRAVGLSASLQQARPLGTTGASQGFYEYLPPGYSDGPPRPLLVFLHGQRENGDGRADLMKVVGGSGPPVLIANNQWPADRPFVVLSPQHAGDDCPGAAEIRAFIASAVGRYRIDERRGLW